MEIFLPGGSRVPSLAPKPYKSLGVPLRFQLKLNRKGGGASRGVSEALLVGFLVRKPKEIDEGPPEECEGFLLGLLLKNAEREEGLQKGFRWASVKILIEN